MQQPLPPPPAARADFRPLSILVGAAYFMEQLDSTIISPAIPDIARDFGIDPLSLNLTMTIYLMCALIFIPLSGMLAARHGTRTVFSWAVGLFVASSVLCAAAPNMPVLTLARALQGVAAAMMVPVGRAALVNVTSKRQLVNALAWMITPAMLGPMLGPPLGGLLSTYLSWHWIFLVNVPVGVAGLLVGLRIMPQLRQPSGARFHLHEWLLASAIVVLTVVLLEQARQAPGAVPVHLLVPLATLIALYVFVFRRLAQPMMDFRLLSIGTFSTGFWAGALVRVGYGALPFLLPLMLQVGLGYSALQSGLVLLVSGTVAFFTKTVTGKVLRRWGFRRVLIWNGLLCALALGACTLFALPHWDLLGIGLIASLAALFRAIQFNALTAIAYADMPAERVAAATTLNAMAWQLAVMLGISLSALTVQWSADLRHHAEPAGSDFSTAFVIVALFSFAALSCYRRLPAGAGAELSGHRP